MLRENHITLKNPEKMEPRTKTRFYSTAQEAQGRVSIASTGKPFAHLSKTTRKTASCSFQGHQTPQSETGRDLKPDRTTLQSIPSPPQKSKSKAQSAAPQAGKKHQCSHDQHCCIKTEEAR